MKTVILDLDLVLFDSVDWIRETCPDCTQDSALNREAWDMHHAKAYMVKVNEDFIPIFQKYVDDGLERVFFITSREDINGMRDITIQQIRDFLENIKGADKLALNLYMRNACDSRPAPVLKEETLTQRIFPYYYVDLAVDDSWNNCKVYMDYNIPTLYYTFFK